MTSGLQALGWGEHQQQVAILQPPRGKIIDFNQVSSQTETSHPISPGADAIESFRRAAREEGIELPGAILDDGVLHRFTLPGDKPRSGNGWYVLYGDGLPAGCFGTWKSSGSSHKWCAKSPQEMTEADRAAHTARMEAMKLAREAERERVQSACREKAASIWNQSTAEGVDGHGYVKRKGIKPYGARISKGAIVLPVFDIAGTLHGLQFVNSDKKFLTGTFKKGNFMVLGEDVDAAGALIICEGWATGCSIHEATGLPIVVAFDAGNLKPVAEAWRARLPLKPIVIAADDDHETEGNPGISKATEAAKAVGGSVVVPPFPASRGPKDTDFNDLAQLAGLEVVRQQFEAVAKGPAAETPSVTLPDSPARVIDLYQWGAERWEGEPPQRRYLVTGRIPLGVAVMVAAMGDTGKSFILLALALLVATGRGMFCCSALGGFVYEFGTAVIFTAEEDAGEVHSRIAALDPDRRRFSNPGKLLVVPLPDAGGPVSLIMQTREGLKVTPEFEMIRAQLLAIPDLKMVVFDPLQNFVQTDINADPAAGQFACAVFAQLAAETGATVILPHHMRKSAKPIETVADARDAIRGTTALVDGLRAAYALWPVADEEARKICKAINVKWEPNRVVAGAVVKANGKADRGISTFVRDDCGVLRDASAQLAAANNKKGNSDQLFVLEEAIRTAAVGGQPFTKTGINGLFDRRSELPESLRGVGRTIIWQLADELLEEGRVVKAIHKGTSKKWLDVPGGPFATGDGVIRAGA